MASVGAGVSEAGAQVVRHVGVVEVRELLLDLLVEQATLVVVGSPHLAAEVAQPVGRTLAVGLGLLVDLAAHLLLLRRPELVEEEVLAGVHPVEGQAHEDERE